ncbi:MAG: PD40 domain-containing protein, partial [Caldilineaceae bacterium]|nr:PD40 domain-containing protein [Caldilineaceae bacterium]
GGVPRQISDFGAGAFTPRWLPDSNGLLMSAERDNRVQLLLTDRQGSWPRGLVTGAGDVWDPQPSPDGKRVLYVRRPFDDLNRLDICMVELESGQVHEVARSQKQINTQPRWAPNGQQIAFLSQRSGYFEIWLINGDGSGLRQLTNVSYDFAEIVWAPDGSQLAATLNRGGAFDLVLVDAGNGAVTYL